MFCTIPKAALPYQSKACNLQPRQFRSCRSGPVEEKHRHKSVLNHETELWDQSRKVHSLHQELQLELHRLHERLSCGVSWSLQDCHGLSWCQTGESYDLPEPETLKLTSIKVWSLPFATPESCALLWRKWGWHAPVEPRTSRIPVYQVKALFFYHRRIAKIFQEDAYLK